jgi:molecular chaperone DnaK (HSP70)
MPSVVYFQQGAGELAERVLIGEDAEAMSISDAAHVIRSIKRCFGCQGTGCSLQDGRNGQRFPWCIGEGKIQVTPTETLLPSEVAVLIMREAVSRAINVIKERYNTDLDISNVGQAPVNLGCGANFNLGQRKVILDTTKALGFTNLEIKNVVEEPILAGFAFSRLSGVPEGRSVIYDFGGGTLDIAVLDVTRKDGKPFVTVLSTAGENWLGGDDIDQVIYQEFVDQISASLQMTSEKINYELTLVDQANLRKMAKTAKEQLSSLDEFRNSLLSQNLGPLNLSLTRTKFETILDDSQLVKKSMDAMLRAFKLAYALDIAKQSDLLDVKSIANLRFEEAVKDIKKVVLVGGVTKIPFVQREIEKRFGKERVFFETRVLDPVCAVSVGGAYPKETDHFSISSPPYGFYLEGIQQGKKIRQNLLAPYTYLEFYRMIHASTIPTYRVTFSLTEQYDEVVLKGKEALTEHIEKIKDLGRLEPGNYQFHVGLDGSLSLVDKDYKPHTLALHKYTHPLQNMIKVEKERRKAEANRYPDRSLAEDYKSLMNEN